MQHSLRNILLVVVAIVSWNVTYAFAKNGVNAEDVGMFSVFTEQTGAPKNGTTINTAIGKAGSLNTTIYLWPGTWTLNIDVTFPTTRHLSIPAGANVVLNSPRVLTLNSCPHVEPPERVWYSGTGSVVINNCPSARGGITLEVQKDLGAKCDNVTDDYAAIQAGLTRLQATGGTLRHGGGGTCLTKNGQYYHYHSAKSLKIEGIGAASAFRWEPPTGNCSDFSCVNTPRPAAPFYDVGMVNISGPDADITMIPSVIIDGVYFDFGGGRPPEIAGLTPPATSVTFDGHAHGINIYYADNVTIINSIFKNSNAEMLFINQYTSVGSRTYIANNWLDNCNVDCMNVTSLEKRIIGNRITRSYQPIEDARHNLTFVGNTMKDSFRGAVISSSRFTVTGNIFEDIDKYGGGHGSLIVSDFGGDGAHHDGSISGNEFILNPGFFHYDDPGNANGGSTAVMIAHGVEDLAQVHNNITVSANQAKGYSRFAGLFKAQRVSVTGNTLEAYGVPVTQVFAEFSNNTGIFVTKDNIVDGNFYWGDSTNPFTIFQKGAAYPNTYKNVFGKNYINGVPIRGNGQVEITASTATLDLQKYGMASVYIIANTVATTITDIVPCVAGYPAGEIFNLYFSTGNTTLQHNSRMHMQGLANHTYTVGSVAQLVCSGFDWNEVGRFAAP